MRNPRTSHRVLDLLYNFTLEQPLRKLLVMSAWHSHKILFWMNDCHSECVWIKLNWTIEFNNIFNGKSLFVNILSLWLWLFICMSCVDCNIKKTVPFTKSNRHVDRILQHKHIDETELNRLHPCNVGVFDVMWLAWLFLCLHFSCFYVSRHIYSIALKSPGYFRSKAMKLELKYHVDCKALRKYV